MIDRGDGRILMISNQAGLTFAGLPPPYKSHVVQVPYGARAQSEPAVQLTPTGGLDGIFKLYRHDNGLWFGLREILQIPPPPQQALGDRRFRFERIDPDTLAALPWRSWEALNLEVAGMDARYIYLVNVEGTFRVDALTGELDPNWKPEGLRIESIVPGNSPEEPALAWGRFGSSDEYRLFAQRHTSTPASARSVVEYYATQSDRYFITGRTDEQASLDALPSHFRRTGMRFQALEGEVSLSQSAWQPVCRFYASRDRGASNTHFYGTQSDCQLLHARTRFAYEGVDFAVQSPASPASCPAEAPQPVYRLFNGRLASNDGNHRYVVSTARRHEMLARGWQDEGLVFCVSSAVDAAPLSP